MKLKECGNCTSMGWPYARSMHPLIKGENYICMDREHALRPQYLVIDIVDNSKDYIGFTNRSIESIFEKDTVKRIGRKFHISIEFRKGSVD